jgi:outer membrane protein
LFTGFRIQSASDIAEYTAQATSQDFSNDKSELMYNIQTSYWNLYKANEFKKVIDENVMQMNAHLKEVQNMFEQGILTKNEVLKVEVQLSNVQVVQLDAQNNVRLAMLALNNIIGTPLSSDIDLDTSNIVQPEDYSDVNRLVQEAMGNRSDVKSMEYRVKAGESGVTFARSGWFPQIYLIGNYYYDRPNQRIFPALDQFQDTWDVSLSVSFDIWNWGNTIHQTNQAQAQLAEVQDGLGQLRDGVTLEVTQNYLNANEAKERITLAEKGVTQAEENYRITHEKFKSGLTLNTDLLDAEAALLQSKWNHIQAVVDRMLAVARLKKSIGGDLISR